MGHYMLIKERNHQEVIVIKKFTSTEQPLLDKKGDISPNQVIVGDFNISFSPIDR
jgi:uncharacterized iron-regulated protein